MSDVIVSDLAQLDGLTNVVIADIGQDKTGFILEKTLREDSLLKEQVTKIQDTMYTIDMTKYISSLQISSNVLDLINALPKVSRVMEVTIKNVSTKIASLVAVILKHGWDCAQASLDCVYYHSNALIVFQKVLKKTTLEEQKRQIQITLNEVAKCEKVAKQFSEKCHELTSELDEVIYAIREALSISSRELTNTLSEKEKLDKQIATQHAKIQGMQTRFYELQKAEEEEKAKQPADHRNFFTAIIPWETQADKDYKRAVEARERHLSEIKGQQDQLEREMENCHRKNSIARSELSIAESVVRVLTDILKVMGVLKTFSSNADSFWRDLEIRCKALQKMNLQKIAINAKFERGVNNSLRKSALYWMAVGHLYYGPFYKKMFRE